MVIFLAGAHGVGKTFLSKPAAESLGLKHFTASTLIREEIISSSWNDSKHTQNIDRNQEALISAVSRITANPCSLLLDGHFVLRNAYGELVELPIDIFRRLGVKSIILIEAPSAIVAQRLTERNAPQSFQAIEEIAAAEQFHAMKVSSELKVNLIKLSSPSESELRSVIQKEIGKLFI